MPAVLACKASHPGRDLHSNRYEKRDACSINVGRGISLDLEATAVTASGGPVVADELQGDEFRQGRAVGSMPRRHL